MTTVITARPTAALSYNDALTLIGGLSRPSKMPWWSWSTPATACITGSKLAQQSGTVCSGCYALKGFYMFPAAKNAMARRLASWEHPRFVEAFIQVLDQLWAKGRKRRADGSRENRFRWFDSGDLQSVEMLQKINEIALKTPNIVHWLPTREAGIVADWKQRFGDFSPNLCVRISAPLVGQKPRRRPQGLPYATVGVDDDDSLFQCPALKLQNNLCLNCDTCWRREADVNYPLH